MVKFHAAREAKRLKPNAVNAVTHLLDFAKKEGRRLLHSDPWVLGMIRAGKGVLRLMSWRSHVEVDRANASRLPISWGGGQLRLGSIHDKLDEVARMPKM